MQGCSHPGGVRVPEQDVERRRRAAEQVVVDPAPAGPAPPRRSPALRRAPNAAPPAARAPPPEPRPRRGSTGTRAADPVSPSPRPRLGTDMPPAGPRTAPPRGHQRLPPLCCCWRPRWRCRRAGHGERGRRQSVSPYTARKQSGPADRVGQDEWRPAPRALRERLTLDLPSSADRAGGACRAAGSRCPPVISMAIDCSFGLSAVRSRQLLASGGWILRPPGCCSRGRCLP